MLSSTNVSLYIVTTSLDENIGFESSVLNIFKSLEDNNQPYNVLVESEKIARRRWISSGLKREVIEKFIPYNEHNQLDLNSSIIKKMENNEIFFLISDEGVPGFFDPGLELVRSMHRHKLKLRCLGLECSPLHALVISGMESSRFIMAGFPPTKHPDRIKFFNDVLKNKDTTIVMDTAYRLKNTLNELKEVENEVKKKFTYFLAMDLSRSTEEYCLGNLDKLMEYTQNGDKKDFVLIKDKL